MRQKVRRLSKSAVSILLSIMMVVSMVAVGLVAVNAWTYQNTAIIYFDATNWGNQSANSVYFTLLFNDNSQREIFEMHRISSSTSSRIYYYQMSDYSNTNSTAGSSVVFFSGGSGWNQGYQDNKGLDDIQQHCTKYSGTEGTNIYNNHIYYFSAASANGGTLTLTKSYNAINDDNKINGNTARNTDGVWSYDLTATSSVANSATGTPSTGNASSTAGGKVAINAAYFTGWDYTSSTGDSTASATTTTYTKAAKSTTATYKVTQVFAGYEFDGWYTSANSTGETNRVSTATSYSEMVTGTRTLYAHFHRAQATITTAVSPSGAGTAQVSTSESGTYESSVTVQSDTNVYLKAENTNNRYEFSEWQAVSGLTFTDRTSAQTSAKATATATATAVFLPINYNLSRQNPTHAKIKIPTQARWGDTVTPSATTDTGWKVSKYKWKQEGASEWIELDPGSGFTMPEHNVIVSADVTECSTYEVTMTPSGSGTISAKTAEGQTISSGDSVNEGTVITFTAAPASNTAFTGWSGTGSASGISGTDSEKTVTINADTSVTATFTANLIQLVTYGTSNTKTDTPTATTNMNLMESTGYYRSAEKVTSGGGADNNGTVFSVKRTIGGVTTYAKSAASGNTWWITASMPAVTPQHWTNDSTLDKKYRDQLGTSGTQHYVFYDPETNKIWLSANADGSTSVKVIAKDGSFADKDPNNPTTSAGWGDTTLKVSKDSGSSWLNGTSENSGYAQTYTLTNAEVESETTKIKVSTTVSKANYYVYGFDINGCVTKKATKNNNAYELEFSPADIETNTSNFIEITPIYMLTDPSLTDSTATPTTIRFYVRSFSGDIKARWGGELYCYAYNNSTNTNGAWPGQPMVNLGGGTYYMDLPVGTEAITLSNAAADWIHATTLGVDLGVSDTWKTRNQYQCQSYDYDDFKYIYAKPGVGENDEDIIFDFKYKQGDWGKSGLDNFNTLTTSANQSSFPNTLTPGNYSGWEDYTDLYGDKIDLWGTKLTSNYNNNPVRIVVQGYYDTSAVNNSYYATTYVVYKPNSTTGSNPSYSLVTYTDVSGYGKKSRSEFLQRSAAQMGLNDLAGQPVQITYEYAIYHDVSTAGTKDKDNQFAERADGVWYHSETKPVKGNIIIQYADNMHSAFTDDTFEIDEVNHGIDYDGDEYTVNVGTETNAKAYFVDNNFERTSRVLTRPTNAPLDVNYTNRTVEWAYTDAYDYFDVKAEESPDGEYTFIGWYKMSGGKPEFASAEYTYQVEASANETFIARYVKTPAGQVKLAHKPVVNNNSEGTGDRKVWYDIVSSSNLSTSLLPSGTTQEANGAITVPKTYVKYGKNYVLKVKFQVDPDDNSRKHGIYSTDTAATANLLTEDGLELHNSVSVDNFALSSSGETAALDTDYVEFSIPIDSFFKKVAETDNEYEFDSEKSLIEVFSDYERITNSINITKTVDFNNSDTFTINVKEQYVPDPAAPETTAFRNYSGKYTVGSDDTKTSFTGDITISGGQTIHIVDVPAGAVFQISESSLPAAYNYGSVSITGVTGTEITQGKQFTMRNDGDVNMTFNNTIKKAVVKVKKVVQDGDSGTTTFPITATIQKPGGSGPIVQPFNLANNNEYSLGELPVGTTISISEDPTSGYERVSVTCDENYVQTYASSFKVVAETNGTNNGLITVTNRKLHNVTVTKTTDWDDYDSNFRIQILTSDDGSNYTVYNGSLTGTRYNPATQQNEDVTVTAIQADTEHYYDIKKNDNLTIPNLATGTYVKIVETNSTENYNFNSATVENEQTGTETAIDTAPKGVQFRVGTTDAAVTINNLVIRHDVTVTKKTFVKNGSTYTDFPYDDGSTFGVKVLFRLLGNSDASAYVPISGGKVNGTTSDPHDGIYTVAKDGVITFTGIPKGSFIAVSEDNANISASDVTKAQRFAFDSTIINSGQAATGDNANAKYVKVADANVSLEVRNIVKQTDVTITKTTNNNDTTSQHTIQVHIYKNGKTSLTSHDEYTTLNYTSSKIAGPQTVAAGGNITIVGGETLTFHYPVGSVVTVKETAPNANFDFSSITVTDAAKDVSGIDNPTTVNGLLTFQTKDAFAAKVNITNNIKTKNLTITKVTNVPSTTDAFKIKLYTSTDNTNWTPYTTALKNATGPNMLAASDSEYTIHKGEQWVMQNLPINTYVKIEESDYNSAAGYTFDGMTGGSVTDVDNTSRTGVVQMTEDKSVTINNNKYHDVTINKVLTNSNNSSAKFKISATVNGTATWTRSIAGATAASGTLTDMEITAGQQIVLKDVPVGATVVVNEPTDTTGFSFVSATYSQTGSGTTGSNETDARNVSFTMGDSNATVTVYNKINNKTFTVEKVTDSHDGSGFGIKVEYKQTNSGAGWTPYDGTDFTNGVVTLAHGGNASVSVPSDASVRITETTVTSGYQFVNIKKGTSTSTTNGTTYNGSDISEGDNITVTNRKLYTVTLTKSLTSSITDDPTEFKINYSYRDKNNNLVEGYAQLRNNATRTLQEIPAGTVITVTEDDKAGYSYVDTTVTGGITAGTNNQYTVTGNGTIQVNNSLKTKTLKLQKAVTGWNHLPATTFPVTVQYYDNSQWNDYTTVDLSTDGTVKDVVLKGVAATARIKVTETINGANDNICDATATTIKVGDEEAVTGTSTEFDAPANNTIVLITNSAKLSKVTVSKQVTNNDGDTTEFPITANITYPNGATATAKPPTDNTLKDNESFEITNLPYGTTFTVTENVPEGYTRGNDTHTGVTESSGTYTVGSTDGTVTVNNSRDTSAFTIKKVTDVNNFTDTFKIQIWTSNDGTDWTPYTDQIGSFTADSDGKYTIKKNDELEIEGLMVNSYIKVQETDGMTAKYNSTVAGKGTTPLVTGSDNTTGIVKIGGTGQGIVITNTTIKQNVTIHKDVLNFANTDSFNVNVKLESEADASQTYNYTGAAIGTLTNNTQGMIALKNNETVTITNVPIGTIVTVTEQALTGRRYSFGSIDVANANKDDAASTGRTVKFTTNNTTAAAAVTIQNDVKTHDIVITKNVLNSTASGVTFPISVSIKPLGPTDTETTTTWNRRIGTADAADGLLTNMEIGNNESITINGVPEGAQVVVTEGTTTNFSCYGINATYTDTPISILDSNSNVDNCTFTVPNSDVDVKVNVAVQNNVNTRQVTIAKQVDDGASDSVTFPIKIEVKKTTDADFVPYNDGSHADGVYAFNPTGTMNITVPLDAQVRVTEQNTIPTDFAFESIVCGNDTVTNAQTYTFEGTLSDTENKTITVKNTKLHKLTVTKTVEGTANRTDTFTFKAYKWNGSAWADEQTVTLKAGETTDVFTKVRKGEKFKVVEVVPDKYTYDATATMTKVEGATGSDAFTDGENNTYGFQNIVMGTADVNVTVNNIVKTKNVTISKTADYTGTDTFTFNVKTKAEGASEASNCTYQYKLNGTGETQTFTNGNVTLERDQSIVIYNVPVDTVVTVQETDAGNATSASAEITNAKSGTDTYDSATKTATFTVGATADPSVAFTNSKNKTLTITKTKPAGDNDFTDNTTTFKIQVKKDNAAYTGTEGTNYTASNDVTLDDGVFTLKMGDTVVLNVTNGERYEISEINIDSKYTLTNVSATGSDSDVTNGKHFTIGNDNASVIFENSIKRANVTVQKLVSGYDSGDDEFPIAVSYTKPGMTAANTTYNLKKDATDTLANLPYGTQVTVSETLAGDMAAKYQLATNGIKYTVEGETQQTGATFNMTDKNVAVTVTNERKPYTVTVGKVVSGDNTDSTEFRVNVNSDEQPISQGHPYTYTAYYGDTVTVSETNLPRGYVLDSISDGTTSGSSYSSTITGNTNITVTNRKLPTYTLTLTKDAGSEADNTEFGITVSSDTARGNYSYQIESGDAVAFNADSEVITLKAGQSAVISGLLAGETLSFVETNQGDVAGYTFDHFTVNGSERESSVKTLTYEVSAGTNNIVVHNVKSAPDEYRYKITYTYPSRFQFIPEKASRFGDQNYTVEGVLLSNDSHFSEYFDTANSKITKALILAKAPHESNFMMNMTWDKDGDDDSNFNFNVDTTSATTVYTGSVRMIEEEQSTKNVQFIFPYQTKANDYSGMCKVVYVPTDYANPVPLPDKETKPAIQVEYQGEVVASDTREVTYTENGETKTKNETFYFHTTAPSQFKGGNFLYWSIRAKNVNTGNFEEVARSYNEIFNYTIFDNYQIEPIYDNYEGVDKTDEANYKATAQFAKLNLLAITRNQWNNDDKGSENVNLKGEDMVYLDFDLAYAFNDYQLSKNSKTLETGLLIQDCGIAVEDKHPLNLDGDQTKLTEDYAYYKGKAEEKESANTLKSASALQALVLAKYQACGTSGSKTEPEAGLTRYAIGKVLTNKNRYELGVTNVVGTISQDNTDVLTGWNYDPSKKTHVYRAYAYIRNTKVDAHGVILSEPVYFTMKNIAEQ